MKVVILGTAYPYRGGLANFNEQLATEFHNQSDEIEIYNFSLQYPNFLFPGKSQFSNEANPLMSEIPNLRKVNSINPFNWIKIGLEIYRKKPDILIFRYWLPFMAPAYSVIGWIAKQNNHTRLLSIVDNAIPHEPRFYDIPCTRIFFSICQEFLAMSQKVINDFKTLSSKKIEFHYHPMYENYGMSKSKAEARDFFQLNKEEKVILFFGFIREYKGLDWLIEGFASADIQSLNVKLIIAGEFYTDAEKYYQLAREKGVYDQIIWKNEFIPDSEVSNYFCSADVVVLPYKHATQSGITQIAYYYQTPIIATKVGGLEELVPHGKVGLVVEPSPQAISQGILKIYSDHLSPIFSENMQEEKIKFTWNSFVQKIKKIIE